ncbi:MAG: GH92 family glycosyl hydrolase [Phycisphaerae bacterium]
MMKVQPTILAGITMLWLSLMGVASAFGAAVLPPLTDFVSFAPANVLGHKAGLRADAALITLTTGHGDEATSVFNDIPCRISAFRAAFTYQAAKLGGGANGAGDGVALVFQNDPRGFRALGTVGGGLGYAGISRSAAFEINIYSGVHQGINVRAAGATGRYDSTEPVDFSSGHPIRVHLNYNGLTLTATLKDEITGRTFTWSKQIDIPLAVNGNRAYVGFTGASGAATAVQTVSDFSFQPEKSSPVLAAQPPADLVNPFIGTGTGPGGSINLFPGPTMPFGMVQLSPDTESRGYGYHYYQSQIEGFSMTHMSGPGCPNEGDVFFTATTGAVHTQVKNFQSLYSHQMQSAKPGYYQVKLLRWGIHTQLTVANRCGIARFTFPAGKQANILIPISHTLNDTVASKIHVVDNREITGYVVDHCFCGNNQTYKVHFVMRFSKPFVVYGTWSGQKGVGQLHVDSRDVQQTKHGQWVGGYASWPALAKAQSITVRVGISYVDLAGAENNLRREVAGKSFHALRRAAWNTWNHALSVIHISGGLPSQREVFYTALYHSMLMPSIFSDADGRYLGFDGKIHHVAAGHRIYCNYSGWDIYRSEMPLLALIAPKRMEDMCQSIVLMYQQGGWIDRWPQINHYTNVMCGSPLTTVMCMAYLDGLYGFNIHAAWQGMFKDATEAPPAGRPYQGESNINWINKLHFDPDNYEGYGSVSQIQEDCVAYSSLYYLAKALGKTRDAKLFHQRALYFRNVFDHKDHDFRPRLSNGQWRKPFKRTQSHGFIEGSGWHYQWLAPCDMAWLVHAVGTARFNRRLEAFCSYKTPGWMAQYYNPYNETDLEAPFEFNFSGKPWRTQYVVRRVLRQNYTLSPNGIPGNDDCGEMSSWAVLSMMGLYTVDPASGAYELCSPVFPKISIRLHAPYTGRHFIITTTAKPAFTPYIRSVTFKDRAHKADWINIRSITRGGHLSVMLGNTPNRTWGSATADAPPSLTPVKSR